MIEKTSNEAPTLAVSRRHLFRLLLPERPVGDPTLELVADDTDDAEVLEATYPAAAPDIDTGEDKGFLANAWVNRRAVLGGMALFAVSCNQTLRTYLNNQWEAVPPSLTFLSGEVPKNPRQIALFLPGFGDMHSKKESRQIADGGSLPPDLPIAYFSESLGDATIKEKADLVRATVNVDELVSIVLIGRSMGGEDAWALAAELGVPVSKIIMFSSPFSLENGAYGNLGNDLKHLPNDREIGFIGKIAYSWLKAKEKNGYSDIFGNLSDAWHNAIQGDDPVTMQARAKTSLSTHLASKAMIKQLEKVIFPGYTKVYYTESNNPGTDHTVHDSQSEEEYHDECQKLGGVKFFRLKAKYNGHANVKATAHMLMPILNEPIVTPPKKVVLADGSK